MNPLAKVFLAGSLFLVAASPPAVAAPPPVSHRVAVELANRNVYLRVAVGSSAPRWFLLDTGCKSALIDLGVARALGLALGDSVAVQGGGKDVVMGYFVKDAKFQVAGLPGFSQPLFLALPMADLSKFSGREIAGVLGFDFLSQFVLEIDYEGHAVTLRDTASAPPSAGERLPITFNAAGHPLVRAQVIADDGSALDGSFVLDIGSGAALILNRPFVEEHRFLGSGRPTVPWLEGRGIGGGIPGIVGRVRGMRVGRFVIRDPVAVFSQAESGPFADTASQGNIGAAILEKFKITLDYARRQVTFEPNGRFAEPIEYDRCGLALVGSGPDYRTVTISGLADHSPATEAGLAVGDTLVTFNGQPVKGISLSDLRFGMNRAKKCELTVRRDGTLRTAAFTPRRAI